MATHSSILAWRMPWTKEPGWLQSVRFQRVRHDCATFTFFFFLMLGKIEGGRRRERQRMRLDRHEFEWTTGVGDAQGCLACCSSWGRKESDTAEELNWTDCFIWNLRFFFYYFCGKCHWNCDRDWNLLPFIKCILSVWLKILYMFSF